MAEEASAEKDQKKPGGTFAKLVDAFVKLEQSNAWSVLRGDLLLPPLPVFVVVVEEETDARALLFVCACA
jgi:hypothetical protein